MTFAVTNSQSHALEFLWASHALFGLKDLQAAKWNPDGWLSDFAVNGSERKLFVAGTAPVKLIYPTYGVTLTTDQPWWGIWINRGGWPAGTPQPLWCLGIEATNTPGEYPAGHRLPPGATFSGRVTVEIDSELSA
jgi:hypothetical protein